MPSDAANAATLARCRRASRLTTSLQHGSKSSRTTSWETIGPGGRHEQQHPATGGDWRPCGTAGWPLRGNSCNRSGARSGAYVLSAHAIAAGKRRPAAARYFSSAVISKRLGWFVVLIAAAVATVVGILMPLFVPVVPFGKGGGGPSLIPYQVPSALMLAGMAGMV